MQELITEIAIYLGMAAFIGFLLGWLIWGMGSRRRMAAARTEAVAAADAHSPIGGDRTLRARIDALTRERDQLRHRVEDLSERLAGLAADASGRTPAAAAPEEPDPPIADSEGEAVAVRTERSGPAGPGDTHGTAGAGDHGDAGDVQSRTDDDGGKTGGDARPFLLADRPQDPDDLTRIRGIGAATAAILNDKGVWLFSQLAGLSPDDRAWLQEELGDQMARSVETWPDQARLLMAE